MTSRLARAASTAGALAAAGLLGAGCSAGTVAAPQSGGTPPGGTPSASPSARPSRPPSPPALPPGTAMPSSPAQLEVAADLADRFASAWDSWSWTVAPSDWLSVLRPMAVPELYPALTQAAGTPAVIAQRKARRQSASATVDSTRIGDVTPRSVTVTVTVSQNVLSPSTTSQNEASFTVVVVPASSKDGWAVWDIEPAGAKNS